MDSENKEGDSKDFGKVIDTLHNKGKLSSLRTYQGDMAEFIKEKNESVISIAVKEKERKEKKEEKIEEEKKTELPVKTNKKGLQMNFAIIFLSLVLVGGGALAFFYVFEFMKKEPVQEVVFKTEIIPYNNSIDLPNVTKESLGPELAKLSPTSGINVIKISDTSGRSFQKAEDFFSFLKVSLPGALERTLQDKYAVGIISQDRGNAYFLVITMSDFGTAFSAMLDWEENMNKDLAFLNPGTEAAMSQDPFVWKDIIIKNKDARVLINKQQQTKIAYSFLDKNTILITNSVAAIEGIASAYASRSVAR